MSLGDFLSDLYHAALGEDTSWGEGANSVWGGPGGMATTMGQNLEDLIRGAPEIMQALGSYSPDESIVQPTIENWSDPNQYARDYPLWMTADVAGAATAGASALGHLDDPASILSRLMNDERGGNQWWPEGAEPRPGRIKGTDPRLADSVDEIGRGRLPMESPLPESARAVGEAYDTQAQGVTDLIDRYLGGDRGNAVGMRKPIEERTPADLGPEGETISRLLDDLGMGVQQQTPVMNPIEEARLMRQIGKPSMSAGDEGRVSISDLMREEGGRESNVQLGQGTSYVYRPTTDSYKGTDLYDFLSRRPSNMRNTFENDVTGATEGMRPETFAEAKGGGLLYDANGRRVPFTGRTDASFDDPAHADVLIREAMPPSVEPFRAEAINPGAEQLSTLQRLAQDLFDEGTPGGHGRFVPKYRPRDAAAQEFMAKPHPMKQGFGDRGPTPAQIAAMHQRI